MTNFSQSKVKSFRRCQKQFSFRHDYAPEGKELVLKVPSLPLKRGSWMHALQESYHRQLAGLDDDWEETHAQLCTEFERLFDEEREMLGDLPGECRRLFRAYLRHWRREEDRFTVATLADGKPAVEFVIEVPLDKWVPGGSFKGRIDLLLEDHNLGGLWIRDAKWVRRVPAPDERMMSPQAIMYVWALRKLGYDVRGFSFDYGRTKPPAIPQILKRGTLTMRQRLDTDYATYLTAIKELHGDRWRYWAKNVYLPKLKELQNREALWFRREPIPVEPERIRRALGEFLVSCRQIEGRPTKSVPRTYDFRCLWDCGYHSLCVAEFQGLDIEPLIKRNYTIEEERYSGEDEVDSPEA